MREVGKEVVEILLDIKKELQAIRSCLESEEVSADTIANTIKDQLREAADQSMSQDDIKAYRSIADREITEESHQ